MRFLEVLQLLIDKQIVENKAEFCKKMSYAPQSLNAIINEGRNVTTELISKMFTVFSVNPTYIHTGIKPLFYSSSQNETAQELPAKKVAGNMAGNVAPNEKSQNDTAQKRPPLYKMIDEASFESILTSEPELKNLFEDLKEENSRLKEENFKLRIKNESYLEMASALRITVDKDDKNKSQQSA